MTAARVYRSTLSAFPRRHRDAYAAEMVEMFQHELATSCPRHGLPLQLHDQRAFSARIGHEKR